MFRCSLLFSQSLNLSRYWFKVFIILSSMGLLIYFKLNRCLSALLDQGQTQLVSCHFSAPFAAVAEQDLRLVYYQWSYCSK